MEAGRTKIISVLVENKPGVLFGVSNLFRRRNFNIESITERKVLLLRILFLINVKLSCANLTLSLKGKPSLEM